MKNKLFILAISIVVASPVKAQEYIDVSIFNQIQQGVSEKSSPQRVPSRTTSSQQNITSSQNNIIPDFIGQNIEYAKNTLDKQGFKVNIIEKLDERIPSGEIFKQYPKPGKSLDEGGKVKLFVSKEPVYSIKGSFSLIDSDRVKLVGRSCYGTGGYNDVIGNLPVTVKDRTGAIIAVGNTLPGKYDVYSGNCVFKFNITEIPKTDFYTIEVISTKRGQLNYSLEEMKKKRWNVSLTLG